MLELISKLVHSIAEPSFIISIVALLIVSLISFFVWTRLTHVSIKVEQLESNQEQLQRQITHGVVLDSTPPLNLRVVPTDDMSDVSADTLVEEEDSSGPIVIERTASPQEASANRELINNLYQEHSTHAMLSHNELESHSVPEATQPQLISLDTLQTLKTIPEEPTEVLMNRAEVDLNDLESLDANIQDTDSVSEDSGTGSAKSQPQPQPQPQVKSGQTPSNKFSIVEQFADANAVNDDIDSDLDSDISTASMQFEKLQDMSRVQEAIQQDMDRLDAEVIESLKNADSKQMQKRTITKSSIDTISDPVTVQVSASDHDSSQSKKPSFKLKLKLKKKHNKN